MSAVAMDADFTPAATSAERIVPHETAFFAAKDLHA